MLEFLCARIVKDRRQCPSLDYKSTSSSPLLPVSSTQEYFLELIVLLTYAVRFALSGLPAWRLPSRARNTYERAFTNLTIRTDDSLDDKSSVRIATCSQEA